MIPGVLGDGDCGTLVATSPLIMSCIEASKASTRVDICVTAGSTCAHQSHIKMKGARCKQTSVQDLCRHLIELGIQLFQKCLNLSIRKMLREINVVKLTNAVSS